MRATATMIALVTSLAVAAPLAAQERHHDPTLVARHEAAPADEGADWLLIGGLASTAVGVGLFGGMLLVEQSLEEDIHQMNAIAQNPDRERAEAFHALHDDIRRKQQQGKWMLIGSGVTLAAGVGMLVTDLVLHQLDARPPAEEDRWGKPGPVVVIGPGNIGWRASF